MNGTYRPTVADFTPTKTQQLSCSEAGKFDFGKTIATAWQRVCKDREARGVSRKARIRGGRP